MSPGFLMPNALPPDPSKWIVKLSPCRLVGREQETVIGPSVVAVGGRNDEEDSSSNAGAPVKKWR